MAHIPHAIIQMGEIEIKIIFGPGCKRVYSSVNAKMGFCSDLWSQLICDHSTLGVIISASLLLFTAEPCTVCGKSVIVILLITECGC